MGDDLLQKYLVDSVEFLEVEAGHWRTSGLTAGAKEIRLVMHTLAHYFNTINQAITDFHGHQNFTLQQTSLLTSSSVA